MTVPTVKGLGRIKCSLFRILARAKASEISHLDGRGKEVRAKVGCGVEGAAATARRDERDGCSKQGGPGGGAGHPELGKSPGWDVRSGRGEPSIPPSYYLYSPLGAACPQPPWA